MTHCFLDPSIPWPGWARLDRLNQWREQARGSALREEYRSVLRELPFLKRPGNLALVIACGVALPATVARVIAVSDALLDTALGAVLYLSLVAWVVAFWAGQKHLWCRVLANGETSGTRLISSSAAETLGPAVLISVRALVIRYMAIFVIAIVDFCGMRVGTLPLLGYAGVVVAACCCFLAPIADPAFCLLEAVFWWCVSRGIKRAYCFLLSLGVWLVFVILFGILLVLVPFRLIDLSNSVSLLIAGIASLVMLGFGWHWLGWWLSQAILGHCGNRMPTCWVE